jgi:hypothetical protein
MTPELIAGRFPWSHNGRYPAFPLPRLCSYIGFHWFTGLQNGQAFGGFQGAHPAAVGIRTSGEVAIIPRIEIPRYQVTMWGETFVVESINAPDLPDDVMLFTPGLWTDEIRAHSANWQTYAPMIPLADRINVFIANEGNGQVPVEKVVKVWDGRAPLPSFGAVLSFERHAFEKRFVTAKTFSQLDQQVRIVPLEASLNDDELSDYVQVMGGLVSLVVDGQHILDVKMVEQARQLLQKYGNATSPIAECGRESRNFDLRIREPAGVLAQTKEQIGWVLFDGRHALSIGASVADVARILQLLEADGVFGDALQQAVIVDGGSAMKVYAIDSDEKQVQLELLNRVAAGSRNGAGLDPDGLNLYTLLNLAL